MSTQDHKWAPGWDNAGSLVAVEDALPFFQSRPCYVRSNGPGTQQPQGILRQRADGLIVETGKKVFIWIADVMSDVQLEFIRKTYTAGGIGYSAKMTVKTLVGDSGSPNYTPAFANFNATLQIPSRADLQGGAILNAFTGVPLRFIVEEAL